MSPDEIQKIIDAYFPERLYDGDIRTAVELVCMEIEQRTRQECASALLTLANNIFNNNLENKP